MRISGRVVCWGSNQDNQLDAPEGSFITVSAGVWQTCGVLVGGDIRCWGDLGVDPEPYTVTGPFESAATGRGFSCGLRTDGAVFCWGWTPLDYMVRVQARSTRSPRRAAGLRAGPDGTFACRSPPHLASSSRILLCVIRKTARPSAADGWTGRVIAVSPDGEVLRRLHYAELHQHDDPLPLCDDQVATHSSGAC